MAALSTRVTQATTRITNTHKTNSEENNMTNLRTVTVTLVDNNPNLKLKQKIVFKAKDVLTEHTDADTLQNIIADGGVKKAVIKHNEEVRAKTVDKVIRNNTGRDVYLEPIELISELQWKIIEVA